MTRGIVAAGVIADDTPDHVEDAPVLIHPPARPGRLFVVVWRLA